MFADNYAALQHGREYLAHARCFDVPSEAAVIFAPPHRRSGDIPSSLSKQSAFTSAKPNLKSLSRRKRERESERDTRAVSTTSLEIARLITSNLPDASSRAFKNANSARKGTHGHTFQKFNAKFINPSISTLPHRGFLQPERESDTVSDCSSNRGSNDKLLSNIIRYS